MIRPAGSCIASHRAGSSVTVIDAIFLGVILFYILVLIGWLMWFGVFCCAMLMPIVALSSQYGNDSKEAVIASQ